MFAMSDGRAAPAHPDAVVTGPTYRFTVLTPQLIRMEWHERGQFVDRPTQAVVDRAFDVPPFTVTDTDEGLEIRTEHLELHYDKRPFSTSGLTVALHRGATDAHYSTWRFGQELPDDLPIRGNLKGTARTLDEVDGATELEPGILSTYGFALLDDSSSVLLSADGWIEPRPEPGSTPSHDLYLFGHGRDFRAALTDFHRLTGPVPLVPRYALGNWWSRYWRYDEESYLALTDRFRAERLPFSVAVIDMDWHVVDVDPELGTGWTGYTWNRELFPDPRRFLAELHERGLAVTLNVHPADGVRRHEDRYADVARAVGIDPESGIGVPFDVTSRPFVDAYLRYLHHPLEDEGVDFWWLDWQSGGVTNVPGLDPLWMLNHLHFRDSGRDGRRPLTFSRYGGVGSHRYPVGFSGDTIVSWASLDFQPFFTATAANVGYDWWSHDIGGHMFGAKDVELAVRWFQLGVFSPVNRLHSSSSAFNGKEPWRFGPRAAQVMGRFLRLRHLLVPYLYTAAWATHLDGVALVRPMYHDHPDAPAAYRVPNQAMVGPDLLLAPITTPEDRAAHLASVRAGLPDGDWYDLFTGHRYAGGRSVTLHRPLETVPVLARAGAVLPLQADPLAPVGGNPRALVLRLVPGDGGTTLVEDDGRGAPGPQDRQLTTVAQRWHARGDGTYDVDVRIEPPSGPGVLLRRSLALDLVGMGEAEACDLRLGQRRGEAVVVTDPADDVSAVLAPALRVDLGEVDLSAGLELRLRGVRPRPSTLREDAFDLIDAAEIAFSAKEAAWDAVRRLDGLALVEELGTVGLPPVLRDALLELVAAQADR